MRRRRATHTRTCPGPSPTESCGKPIIGRGALAERCKECARIRDARTRKGIDNRANIKYRAKQRERKRLEVLGARLDSCPRPKPMPGEQKREKIDRCRVCLGTPHLREPGRCDESGVPVCLPGMARCRLCWEPYAPLPAIHARPVLGSSAATAEAARSW